MVDLTITASNVGVADSKPRVLYGSCGETITAGQAVYRSVATKKWMLADSNSPEAEVRQAIGIALNGGSLNQPIQVLQRGKITIGATLVSGSAYYLSNNPGGICLASDVVAGDYICHLGLASSASVLDVAIQFPNVITGGIVAPSARNLQAAQSLATIGQAATAAASSALSAQTLQFFDRLITIPSPIRQGLYRDLIDGLVADGVWSNLDLLCIPAAAELATATTNLVSATYQAQPQDGGEIFTADRGWVGTASSTSYISTNFNPSAAAHYTRNSAFLAAWNVGAGTQIGRALITCPVSSIYKLFPKWDSPNNNTYIGVSEDPFGDPADNSTGDTTGWFVGDRADAGTKVILRNNTQLGSFSTASVALESDTLQIGNGDPSWITAVYAFGSHLTTTQHTALYNRLHTYLLAVGAVS
jgi:hypothetical protein